MYWILRWVFAYLYTKLCCGISENGYDIPVIIHNKLCLIPLRPKNQILFYAPSNFSNVYDQEEDEYLSILLHYDMKLHKSSDVIDVRSLQLVSREI